MRHRSLSTPRFVIRGGHTRVPRLGSFRPQLESLESRLPPGEVFGLSGTLMLGLGLGGFPLTSDIAIIGGTAPNYGLPRQGPWAESLPQTGSLQPDPTASRVGDSHAAVPSSGTRPSAGTTDFLVAPWARNLEDALAQFPDAFQTPPPRRGADVGASGTDAGHDGGNLGSSAPRPSFDGGAGPMPTPSARPSADTGPGPSPVPPTSAQGQSLASPALAAALTRPSRLPAAAAPAGLGQPLNHKSPPPPSPPSLKLYSTGVDNYNAPLADGAPDPHYTVSLRTGGSQTITATDTHDHSDPLGKRRLTPPPPPSQSGNAFVVDQHSPAFLNPTGWLPDDLNSKWIASVPLEQNDPPGSYTYETTFDLTGCDPQSAGITGQYAADDNLSQILLNGVVVAVISQDQNDFRTLSLLPPITSAFVPGINTLDFVTTNGSDVGANPNGLRLLLNGSAQCTGPTPTTTQLTSTAQPATPGAALTYKAVVLEASPDPNGNTPSGTVTFSLNGQTLQTVPLSWNATGAYGEADLTGTAPAAAGLYPIQAVYSGDAHFVGSQDAESLNVEAPTPTPASSSDSGCGCGSVSADQVQDAPAAGGQLPARDSEAPVRFFDGVVHLQSTDLSSGGFGTPWGKSRSWSNGGYGGGDGSGSGWVGAQTPYLLALGGTTLAEVSNGDTARYFDLVSGSYQARYFDQTRLTYDGTNHQYTLTDEQGDRLLFADFSTAWPAARRGQLLSFTDPANNVTTVSVSGGTQTVQRSTTNGGTTVTEAYVYTDLPAGDPNAGLVGAVVLQRQVNGGAWSVVRQVQYRYYQPGDRYGNPGDLKTAAVADAAGNVLDTSYYRYYTPGDPNGYPHGLKYVFTPESYARLVASLGGADPSLAGDGQVAPYADNYYEYDGQERVSREAAQASGASAAGGLGTFTYSYTASGNPAGYNSWAVKTVETLPDGNQDIAYTNAYGEVMLKVFHDVTANKSWDTFYAYDSQGRNVLEANPSAVTGYDDSKPDLLGADATGHYQYLRDNDGLLTRTDYASMTTAGEGTAGDVAGYVKDTAVLHGQKGTAVLQSATQYYAHSGGGATVYPVATSSVYRNPTANLNDPSKEQTTYTYSWFAASTQMQSMTVSKPVVAAGQNGPGTADVETTVDDSYGREMWHKDADGFLTYTAYDPATSAVVKTIQDVDTTKTGDFTGLPAGWSTPPGGGLHLITRTEVDALGRTTALTRPDGNVTYTLYQDATHQERTYPGWYMDAGGAYHTTGPIQVSREDRGHSPSYSETFTMAVSPGVTNGRPDGSEAVGNLQTLSRRFTSAGGQAVETDQYFNLAGLVYATDAYLGTAGQVQPDGSVTGNYWATTYGYDARGRQNRQQDPTGTVTRTDYDGLSRVTDVWTGTGDANLVKISHDDYDQDQPQGIGDGNLTAVTAYPGGGAAARLTQNYYDWRDRLVADKQGVQGSEDTTTHRPITYRDLDNLSEVVAVERYDGDNLTVTVSNGVPNRPPESARRARTATLYDDQSRAYESDTYNVSQTTGTLLPSDAAPYRLVSSIWYNHRGEAIKTSAPGGLVTKAQYDGAGRVVQSFQTDGAGDVTWADAGRVGTNNVLSQTVTTFDGNGNALLVVTLERFHNATATGALSRANARISYVASYYDQADRPIATVDVGTNGGTDYSRPPAVPSRSSTVLVTSRGYNDAGWVADVTDPRGLTAHSEYDNLGRTVKAVEDYTDGVPTSSSNRTTRYTYDGAGHTVTLTAVLPQGQVQTTQYVYGVSAATGSSLTSNDLLAATLYPDKTTGLPSTAEQESYTYDALGEMTGKTDRNGTTHAYSFDVLGRQTADSVTMLGQGVDGHVLRLQTAYDTGGRPYLYTSYDAASGGNVVNQVQQAYNGLGQLITEYQSHTGAVNTGNTPKVQYAYNEMSGGANNSRLVSMTYPGGRVLHYGYNAGLDDRISRLSFLADDNGSGGIGTHLEDYLYLGLSTVVARAHPQAGVDLSYIKQSGEPNGDAGDQYTGLDRFGRIVDQRWVSEANGSATDRFQYGYDADGNPLYRDNLVEPTHSFGELYQYDQLNRLTSFGRGMLNATHDGFVGVPSHTQSWSLDIQGNWLSVTTDGNQQSRTHNQQNQIASITGQSTPGYDANGNTTTDETGKTLVYDAWNWLVRVLDVNSNQVASYGYDALGRRITETGTAARDLYFSSAWQVLEEQVAGVTQAQYVWSAVYVDALVERDAGGGRLYVQQDANWNVTALVDTTGTVVERFVYDPYGQVTVLTAAWATKSGSSHAWVYLFQGGRYDAVSGSYTFRNRDYSPTLGRWMQLDPRSYAAGDTNLYRAENDAPIQLVDPFGEAWEKLDADLWKKIMTDLGYEAGKENPGFGSQFQTFVGNELGRAFKGAAEGDTKYNFGPGSKVQATIEVGGKKVLDDATPDWIMDADKVKSAVYVDAKAEKNIDYDTQAKVFIASLGDFKGKGVLLYVTLDGTRVLGPVVKAANDNKVQLLQATTEADVTRDRQGKITCARIRVKKAEAVAGTTIAIDFNPLPRATSNNGTNIPSRVK